MMRSGWLTRLQGCKEETMYHELHKDYEGWRCPVCHTDNVTFIEFNDCGHYIQRHCKCEKCGSDLWFQFYIDGCDVTEE